MLGTKQIQNKDKENPDISNPADLSDVKEQKTLQAPSLKNCSWASPSAPYKDWKIENGFYLYGSCKCTIQIHNILFSAKAAKPWKQWPSTAEPISNSSSILPSEVSSHLNYLEKSCSQETEGTKRPMFSCHQFSRVPLPGWRHCKHSARSNDLLHSRRTSALPCPSGAHTNIQNMKKTGKN